MNRFPRLLLLLVLCFAGCQKATVGDRARYVKGQDVYVVDGIYQGREAVIGLYFGNGVYQLNHIKGAKGEGDYVGTLRDHEITDVALVNQQGKSQ